MCAMFDLPQIPIKVLLSVLPEPNIIEDEFGFLTVMNIKQAEDRLNGDKDLEGKETIELWQKIRKDRIEMKDLPDNTITELTAQEDFDPNLDPYD